MVGEEVLQRHIYTWLLLLYAKVLGICRLLVAAHPGGTSARSTFNLAGCRAISDHGNLQTINLPVNRVRGSSFKWSPAIQSGCVEAAKVFTLIPKVWPTVGVRCQLVTCMALQVVLWCAW
jgi:hypothetical protein